MLILPRRATLGLLTAGMPTAAALAQPLSLNLASTLAPAKAKLAAGQSASIVVLGDSLSFRDGSWLPDFRDRMQSAHGDAGLGHMAVSPWTGANFGPGFTFGDINSDSIPHRSLDGLWSLAPAPQGSCTVHAGSSTCLTLLVAGEPGAGNVTATAAGCSPVLLSAASDVPLLRTLSITNPSGLADVTFSADSGPVTFLGTVLSTGAPGVAVHRCANGGWGVDNFLQRDWTFDAELARLAPELVYVWVGQNDQGYTPSTYPARIDALVDRVLIAAPSARIVLVGTLDSGGPGIPGVVAAMQSVAQARALGFVNLYTAAGTQGFLFSSGYVEGVHLTPPGGAYVGKMMFDAFESDGAAFCDVHIVGQPAPLTMPSGGWAELSVSPSGGSAFTCQWRRDGVPLADDGRVRGSTTTDLVISPADPSDTGSYDVIVSSDCGTATSDAAMLVVAPLCPADYNRDGYVTGDDFDGFTLAFYWGDPSADFNGDGFVNGDDFDGFSLAFDQGC